MSKSSLIINNFLAKTLKVKIKRVVPRHAKSVPKDLENFNFSNFVNELDTEFKKSVKHIAFLDTKNNSKKLTISLNKRVRSIRVDLPTNQHLCLHSIELYDENNNKISASHVSNVLISTKSKSIDKLSPDQRVKRFLSSTGSHDYAFCTFNNMWPWVILSLKDYTHVSSIVIKNVDGPMALYACGMRVFSSFNMKDWTLEYDLGGIGNFDASVDRIAKEFKLQKYQYGNSLRDFCKNIFHTNDTEALNYLNEIPSKHWPAISSEINRSVLQQRDLEWISHGVRRSFRFWNENEKIKYIKSTAQLIDDLSELSKYVSLGFGSVLAAYRDKDLIPHDDDMDTIIGFNSSKASTLDMALDIVKEHLLHKGYSVDHRFFSHWHVRKNGFKMDVFVGIFESDGTIGWYPGPRKKLSRSDIYPTKSIELLGISTKIPRNTDKYLEVVYGNDWMNPNPTHSHKWSPEEYKFLNNS